MFWPYLAVPVGGALMLLQLAEMAVRLWRDAPSLDYLAESEMVEPEPIGGTR